MPSAIATPLPECNCLALRQATRHLTQFYDQHLAPAGLRNTQFSILVKLRRQGPMTINALARELVMDRTTLGRTMLPLARDGLISIKDAASDRRSRELRLTPYGAERVRIAAKLWSVAQAQFEEVFGGDRASRLRNELRALVSSELRISPVADQSRRQSARPEPHAP